MSIGLWWGSKRFITFFSLLPARTSQVLQTGLQTRVKTTADFILPTSVWSSSWSSDHKSYSLCSQGPFLEVWSFPNGMLLTQNDFCLAPLGFIQSSRGLWNLVVHCEVVNKAQWTSAWQYDLQNLTQLCKTMSSWNILYNANNDLH